MIMTKEQLNALHEETGARADLQKIFDQAAMDAATNRYGWTKVYYDTEKADIVVERTISEHIIASAKEGSAGQYRQRPVDAWCFNEENRAVKVPDWMYEAFTTHRAWGGFDYADPSAPTPIMSVYSPHGTMIAGLGDWIIRSSEGGLSVCTADVFPHLYEAIR